MASGSSLALTVVTCNYNHGHYLPEAIDSVVRQKFISLEHIIIDDGSTDSSIQVIEEYKKKYPWIRSHYHRENKGVAYSINEAVEMARGKYIHFLSADDVIFESFFQQSVSGLESNPQAGLCCSRSCFFSADPSQSTPDGHFDLGCETQLFSPSKMIDLYKKTSFWISGANVLRLGLVRKYGLNPQHAAYLDWFLYQQIALLHGVVYIPKVFYGNRVTQAGYAKSISEDAKKRNRAFYYLLLSASQHENKQFRKLFRKAASLMFYGKPMLFFLAKHPRFWSYIPAILIKKILRRK